MQPQCPFCKALAYEGATSCPHCGAPLCAQSTDPANGQIVNPSAPSPVDLRTVNRSQLQAAHVSGAHVEHNVGAGPSHEGTLKPETPPAEAAVELRPAPVPRPAAPAASGAGPTPQAASLASEPGLVIGSGPTPAVPGQQRTSGQAAVATGPAIPARPVEIWVVVSLLAGLALFLLVPALQLAYGVLPGLAGGSFALAISALVLMLATMIGAVAVALLGVAVLIFHADHVGQALVCLLGSVIFVGVVLSPARSNSQIGVAIGCLAAIALVTGTPAARTYFKRDERPLGIVVTTATITYLSGLLIACGFILLPVYAIGPQYALYGVSFIAGGALLHPVNRGLKAGAEWSRIAASVILGGFAALTLVIDHQSPQSLMTAAVCVAPLALLWIGQPAAAHFSGQGPGWQ
jgi:hypothetical protein